MKKPIVSTFLRCAVGFFLCFGAPRVRGVTLGGWKYSKNFLRQRVRGVTLGGWKYSKNFLRQVGSKTLVIFHDICHI